MNDLHQYCLDLARRAKAAAAELAQASGAQKQKWLRACAALLAERTGALIEANRLDLAAAPGYGLTEAQIDRLQLTPARIAAMGKALEEVAALPEPIGEVISSSVRPNGLEVQKVRVPLGVIFFIYESRPNVTSRRRGHLRQERQRRDPPRRQRGRPLQRRDRGNPGRGRRRSRVCRRTPCSWWPPPIAPRSTSCCTCPSTSTWPFPAAARA